MSSGNPPRVLMFAPAFAPLVTAEAIVNGKLALAMHSYGWHVDVISCQVMDRHWGPDCGHAWTEPWLGLRPFVHQIKRWPRERTLTFGLQILGTGFRTGHFVHAETVSQEMRLAMALHKREPYDLILSRALPISAQLSAMLMARRTGLPWIANFNDPVDYTYPGAPGFRMRTRLLGWNANRLARAVGRAASVVTFPCVRLRDFMVRGLGTDSFPRTEVIPHVGLAGAAVSPSRSGCVFTLCHSGSLGLPRRADLLLRAFARLLHGSGRPNAFRFTLVGSADPRILRLSSELGILPNIEHVGAVDYLTSLRHLNACDVQVVVESPIEEGIYLPSKVVDYAQTGRPILAVSPRKGTLTDILGCHGGGIAADCEDEEAVLRALATMYDCWKHQRLQQEYGAQRLYDLFDPTRIVAQYAAIYKRIRWNAAARICS